MALMVGVAPPCWLAAGHLGLLLHMGWLAAMMMHEVRMF